MASNGANIQTHCKAAMAMTATFHLMRWNSTMGMAQALAFDRLRYRNAPGLQLLRVLGTGKGASTAPSTQMGRTALFCLFGDEASADAHVAQVVQRRGVAESWHVKLRGVGGHGAWRGVEIPRMMSGDASSSERGLHGGNTQPLAIVTRADVRLRAWRTFSEAARVVDHELHQSDGLLAVVGIGEAPILRLGTFSLWRDAEAMSAFAHRAPQHDGVVTRTRKERWYGEEMFARFTPYWSTGTWDGVDPLRSA